LQLVLGDKNGSTGGAGNRSKEVAKEEKETV
jgi:hypothetical protein